MKFIDSNCTELVNSNNLKPSRIILIFINYVSIVYVEKLRFFVAQSHFLQFEQFLDLLTKPLLWH